MIYNFDPLAYLECGVRGSVGGYKEGEVLFPHRQGNLLIALLRN